MSNRFEACLADLEANEAQAAAPTQQTTTLLSDIVTKLPPKTRGTAHNIYLSKPVSMALEREAARRKMTKGKLVDEVLKRVLGVEP